LSSGIQWAMLAGMRTWMEFAVDRLDLAAFGKT
jgi:hypothetical protein